MKRQFKKVRKVFISALIAGTILTTFPNAITNAAKKPSINKSTQNILVKDSYKLKIKNPVKQATYVWKTSNPKIATVNKNGKVTILKKGSVTIICEVKTKSKTFILKSKINAIKPAKSVEINNKTEVIQVDIPYQLENNLVPKSSNDKIKWLVDDPSIAEIDKDGQLTLKKPGTVTITSQTLSGKTDTVTMLVLDKNGTVTNQNDLNKALLSNMVKQITIHLNKEETQITIPKGNYKDKDITIYAPNSRITNQGLFHSITIQNTKANGYIEKANGNSIQIKNEEFSSIVSSSLIIDKNASVSSITISSSGKIHITANGLITSINIKNTPQFNLAGTYSDGLKVKVEGNTNNIQLDIDNVNIEVEENGKADKITINGKDVNIEAKDTEVIIGKNASNVTCNNKQYIAGKNIIIAKDGVITEKDSTDFNSNNSSANSGGSSSQDSSNNTENKDPEKPEESEKPDDPDIDKITAPEIIPNPGTSTIITNGALTKINTGIKPKLATKDYNYTNWFSVFNRYLYEKDGKIQILQYIGNKIIINQFDENDNSEKIITVPAELPKFGGFHQDEDGYYYLVFGQNNPNSDNNLAVYRVVKYDKDWKRIQSVDINDVFVTKPFDACNISMTSRNGKLVIYGGRIQYKHTDGLNHQSNIDIHINTKDMTVSYKCKQFDFFNISHCFAGFVKFDDENTVYVSHGDAYPRSIALTIANGAKSLKQINLATFTGETGNNKTGGYLGGFELSPTNYLTVYSKTDNLSAGENAKVYLSILPKNEASTENTITKSLTDGTYSVKETHIVKINTNKYLIFWRNELTNDLYYQLFDGTGKEINTASILPDTLSPQKAEPIVIGNNVIWYGAASINDELIIYKLNTNN